MQRSTNLLAGTGTPGSLLAILKEWWRPLLTAIGLCLVVLVVRPSDSLDRRLSDKLLVKQQVRPDPALVIVEIDAEDARLYGGPPISRPGLTLLMNRIADAGAKRTLLDIYLGERLIDASDARLEQALARFGPDRLGMVTAPLPENLPLARFARHATVLDARLTPDIDGWHRHTGENTRWWGYNATRWLGTGRTSREAVDLDIRIAAKGYRRLAARDVVTRDIDLSGKLVIVTVSSTIAPTRAYLPHSEAADRGAVLAVGAQSLINGYPAARARGLSFNTVLQIGAIVLGFLCAISARSGRQVLIRGAATTAILMWATYNNGLRHGVEIYPAGTVSILFLMINVTLAQRLKLVPMMASFLKGDVSPEEAWAWRSWEKTTLPVVLFSADGRVKRHSPAAAGLVEAQGEGLVAQCMPRFGERARTMSWQAADGEERFCEIEWPYDHVPIAVLRDTTDAEQIERELRAQLMTDELTGRSNRRGFDFALNRASQGKTPYTVFFLDMNGFKAVNDTYGHDAGDELLIVAADRLAANLRQGDTLARLGGDEFGVVMVGNLPELEVQRRARLFREAVARPIDLSASDVTVHVGVACGFATAEAGVDPADVLRRADKAMYRNKADMKQNRRAA